MAVDTTEPAGAEPSGFYPGETPLHPARPIVGSPWLRPHILWAMVGAAAGYLVGHWLGNLIAGGYDVSENTGQNNVATVLALAFLVVGWLAGIGAFTYPLLKLVGREP